MRSPIDRLAIYLRDQVGALFTSRLIDHRLDTVLIGQRVFLIPITNQLTRTFGLSVLIENRFPLTSSCTIACANCPMTVS